MTLPDTAFFDLMRSALGNIKTPFNKQNILEDLSTFLSRPEIQETIAAFLDNADRRIIAAVAALGEPVPGEMESFFSGEYSYADLHNLLLNLEERLVIYRFREDGLFRIALNPRLEGILAPAAAGRSLLFAPVSGPDPRDESGVPPATCLLAEALSGRVLAALFCFFLSERPFVKPDASDRGAFSLRKKALDDGEKLFPGLDLETIAGAFLSLGVLEQDGERFRAGGKRLAAFRELSPLSRLEYLAAGSALYLQSLEPNPLPGYVHRGLLKSTARFINSLLCSLGLIHPPKVPGPDGTPERLYPKPDSLYPKPALLKCGELLRREELAAWGYAGGLPPTGIILKALEITGLVIPAGNNYAAPLLPAGEAPEATDSPAAALDKADAAASPGPALDKADAAVPVIAMDSPFSLILYPGISFADALDLASFCEVGETGTAVRFSLSRESVVRGFNRGFRAAYLWNLLERLSGGRAGEALKWNLEDWEKRYREVALYQGVVLSLGRERIYMAESGPLAAMVREVLAPGIFLLDASRREEAAEVLREAGVDIVALPEPEPYTTETRIPADSGIFPELFSPQTAAGGEKSGSESPNPTEPTASTDSQALPESPASTDSQAPLHSWDDEKAERLKEKFRAYLEAGGKRYSKEEYAELLARIERRLVVSESQLQDISIRYEKLEARSLDYAGKAAIAKQAVIQGALLEVSWPSGGNQETVLGTPENLEKKGGETILILRSRSGRTEPLRIPLGKISVLRRIKQSIFGE
jgi:hypothetical protein